MKLIDLTGKRFGRLVVIERHPMNSKQNKPRWVCICDCGNTTIVGGCELRSGNTSSCGCKQRCPTNYRHGYAGTKIYQCYYNMLDRCYNPKNSHYKYYGERGITVCEDWLNDFNAFHSCVSKLRHYGEKGYSIDRINVNGNYEPENIRWATVIEQAKNKRKKEKNNGKY